MFTPSQKAEFLKLEPRAAKWFRRWMGAKEFINGIERWFLWLGDCPPNELREMPECVKRVNAVKAFRKQSKRVSTLKLAEKPRRLQVETLPEDEYLFVPSVSSERRRYIPLAVNPPEIMASNLANILKSNSLYTFGVLTSTMHMAWVKQVCGRLKSDYRYSLKLVYNNFPWPEKLTDKRKETVEKKAQAVIDARAKFPEATYADLYDPVSTPAELATAHTELDRAVDACYRSQPFSHDRARVEHLFALYEKLLVPLTAGTKAPRKSGRKSAE